MGASPNELIHQLLEIERGKVRAKCGYKFKQRSFGEVPHGTGFASRVTCELCGVLELARTSATDYDNQSQVRQLDREKETIMAREPKQIDFPQEMCDEVVALRDNEEYKWDQIGETLEIPPGKAMLIYSWAKLPKRERIKNASAEDIVRLRDEQMLSWGEIVVRVGYPESSCRSMYEESTGKSTKGNRIGKGGRHPGPQDEGAAPAKKAPAKKAAAKKAAPVKGGSAVLEGMEADEIKEKLTGRAIKVHIGDDEEVITVKSVKRVTAKTIVIADETGSGRTVKKEGVFQISRKKVL